MRVCIFRIVSRPVGSPSQNILNSDLKKSKICPIWGQSNPIWTGESPPTYLLRIKFLARPHTSDLPVDRSVEIRRKSLLLCVSGHWWPPCRPDVSTVTGLLYDLARGVIFPVRIGSDWPQKGQSWDFLRSVRQNEQRTDLKKSKICPIWG